MEIGTIRVEPFHHWRNNRLPNAGCNTSMKILLLVGFLTLWSNVGYAQELGHMAPSELVKDAVEGVMTAIKADPASRTGDIAALTQVVERKFLPYTNFEHTTRLAVGNAWKTASVEQQKQMFEQFQTLLTRVYAVELTQVSGQNVKFIYQPVPVPAGATDVIARTRMLNNGCLLYTSPSPR